MTNYQLEYLFRGVLREFVGLEPTPENIIKISDKLCATFNELVDTEAFTREWVEDNVNISVNTTDKGFTVEVSLDDGE